MLRQQTEVLFAFHLTFVLGFKFKFEVIIIHQQHSHGNR